MSSRNLMIVQGGGPTAVFNASLASVIREGQRQASIGRIFGARFGTRGLALADIVDLSALTGAELKQLSASPGAALGTSRFKPSDDDLQRVLATLRSCDIGSLIFMGGNGTMLGAQIIASMCQDEGLDVRVIGVPKTIDNDIAMTDRCPGYASAARYVAQSTRDLGMDIRSLPQPVSILEVMGRNVGWLAGAAALAQASEEDAPHLIYLPETPFREQQFLSSLDNIVSRQGWAVVVVSEGARREDGSLVYVKSDPAQLDPLKRPMTGGVGQYMADVVGQNLKLRCRSEKPGLLGRVSSALVSRQDVQDAELAGRAAVQALVDGESGEMVSLRPLSSTADAGYELVPLALVAGHERLIPAEWLSGGPLAVNEGFCRYVRGLIGELGCYAPSFSTQQQTQGVS